MKVYQLVSYANAWDKKKKQWESLRSITVVYIGRAGLRTAREHFEREVLKFKETTIYIDSKYEDIRGKVELHEPHVHDNGTLAYWGDKIILSHNPQNI
jgi:hypothetical protein